MIYKIKVLRENAKLKIYGKSKIVSIPNSLQNYGHLKYNFIELTQRYGNLKNHNNRGENNGIQQTADKNNNKNCLWGNTVLFYPQGIQTCNFGR